jgi:hypothetical protein
MPARLNVWTVDDNGSRFIVRDKNGQALADVYFERDPGRRTAANLLTRDEARRIAANIANGANGRVPQAARRGNDGRQWQAP